MFSGDACIGIPTCDITPQLAGWGRINRNEISVKNVDLLGIAPGSSVSVSR